MNLNAWIAHKRRAVFECLEHGQPPGEGGFSEDIFKEGKAKGKPQMGTTRYSPTEVFLEFIFADPTSSATVLTVTLTPPERIVFMPIPPWVIESIWQGEIDGSYHFESDALKLLAEFGLELDAPANEKWFEKQPAKRRE